MTHISAFSPWQSVSNPTLASLLAERHRDSREHMYCHILWTVEENLTRVLRIMAASALG